MCEFFIGESLTQQQSSEAEQWARAYALRHPAPVLGTATEPGSGSRAAFWRRRLRLVLAHG